MSKTIGFGFIGAGQIAHHAAKEVNQHEQSKVVAAFDPDADRLKKLCDEQDIPSAHKSAEELFANEAVDVVYVAVPNCFHAPLATEALRAGRNVILEKPFAMSYEEAEQVAAVARETGKTLLIGMNQRYNENAQKVRKLVQDGDLGEVYHAKAHWFRRSGIPRLGTWFGSRKMAGGGALMDIGVHLLDLCLFTMDNFEPVSVSGSTYTKFGNRGLGEGGWGYSDREGIPFDVDDFATALIKFKNGASVSLDVTWACHTEENNRMDVQLYGTEAGAAVSPPRLFKPGKEGEYDIVTELDVKLDKVYENRFHNIANHLLNDEPLLVTIEQALAVQKILDAVEQSSQTGREVRFD